MSKKSINIIGSGIGGLCCGAVLAKHGFNVTVFEATPQIGGYATSWKKDGYTFEASLHSINGFETDDAKYALFKYLDLFKILKPVHIDSPYTSVFKDFSFKAPGDFTEFENALIKEFPEETKAIKKVCKVIKDIGIQLNEIGKIKSQALVYLLTPFKFPAIFKNLFKSVYDLVGKKIKNPRLRTIITQLFGYYSHNIKQLSLLFFAAPTYSYITGGFWVSGTSSKLAKALVRIITDNGGQVLTRKKVTKLICDDKKKVTGLVVNDNEEYNADITICNNSVIDVYANLLDKQSAPTSVRKRAINTVPSTSIFTIYMGMDTDVRKLGITDYSYFINQTEDVNEFNQETKYFEHKDRTIVLVSYNLDDSVCPDGKSVMSMSILDKKEYWEQFGDDKEAYNKEKERVSQILLDKVESLFPGFKSHIETIFLATPKTMERYTLNPGGAIYGACQRMSQAHIRRFPIYIKKNNLYFSSAWVLPGGGISGVFSSAFAVSRQIIDREHPQTNKLQETFHSVVTGSKDRSWPV